MCGIRIEDIELWSKVEYVTPRSVTLTVVVTAINSENDINVRRFVWKDQ